MRKIYLMLFLLACSLSFLQAQGWYVYNGSGIPDQTGWSNASNTPGPNFVEEILDDPNIEGNEVFRFIMPDPRRIDNSGTASKYYRKDFTDRNPAITIVARMKGFPIDTVTGERIFNIEYSEFATGLYNVRDALVVMPDDSTISLERVTGSAVKANLDLNKWQVYRITFSAADSISRIYLNEDVTPIITGKSSTNNGSGNNYLRMGDGGTPRFAGYIDWVIIDTTGAYAPGAGVAIPDSLSTASNVADMPGFGKKIVFLTDTTLKGIEGYYADSNYIRDLSDNGFVVTMVPRAPVTAQSDALKALVNASDAIIIGRGCNSSDFQNGLEVYWEKLQKPIIMMSNLIARSNRSRWLPSTTMQNLARFGTVEGKVADPDDAAFKNMILESDSIIPFLKDNIGLMTFTPEQLAKINGEVIVSLINGPEAYKVSNSSNVVQDTIDLSDYDGTPLMIRFAPLDSMYTGLEGGYAAARPFHWRTYITGGDDTDWDTVNNMRKRGYYVHSPEMINVLVNELLYLIGQEAPNISDDMTLSSLTASVGTFTPEFVAGSSVTSYTLSVPKGTTSVTINATPNHPEAQILKGTGAFTTIPGTDTIQIKSQAGSIGDIYIVVKFESVVVGNVIPPGFGTIEEYLAVAEDGDTLYLMNDSLYVPIDILFIDKKITLMSQTTPELPGLLGMPMIYNAFSNNTVIQLNDGADLTLIGLDIDADGMLNIISMRGSQDATVALQVNRCRLHNTSGDIIRDAVLTEITTLKKCVIKNTFLYDAGAHAAYIRGFYGTDNDPYVFQDITYWNLGQQFNWARHQPSGTTQKYVFNHMTGYYLSTDASQNKELLGNAADSALLDITLTNSIFSTQVSTFEYSLWFDPRGGENTITLRNIVLHDCQPAASRSETVPTPIENQLTDDPQFADPANGDFTIGNEAYLTAADNDTVIGARYWHPDFVDDFCDMLNCGGTAIKETPADLTVEVAPIPFTTEVNFRISLERSGVAAISIVDLSGRTVKSLSVELNAGLNQVSMNTSDLETGAYMYTISTGKNFTSGRLIKTK